MKSASQFGKTLFKNPWKILVPRLPRHTLSASFLLSLPKQSCSLLSRFMCSGQSIDIGAVFDKLSEPTLVKVNW